ncbi:stage V sporulation protein AB [Anaeropeptidivorans aminofermentans]|uniref:stage V sporulation protein AB n=1 Tax=Anaeropeptidivorans aminofermentans TaxID=2934315 RepID=UPI002023D7DB|nr:stage V sporulation protein AB [Anaeropeptidivorans aminofermentans]
MLYLKYLLSVLIGLGGGVVISGAVFAFIAIIGVVPRLAQKTSTESYIKLYEEMIILGGIFGCVNISFDYSIRLNPLMVIYISVCIGIFYGCLAMCLAEVLDVLPILARRTRLQKGMKIFILSMALGKLAGSLLYFMVDGFFEI